MKEFIVCIILISLMLVGLVYVISYTPDTTKADEQTFGLVPNYPVELTAGKQKVVVVHETIMKNWLESAGQKAKIVSVTGIGVGSYGRDNYFLIVFEDVPVINTVNPELSTGRAY